MGPGWRAAAAGSHRIWTEGSRYLLVTLLLLSGTLWSAGGQTEDGRSVYFWETGTMSRPALSALGAC